MAQGFDRLVAPDGAPEALAKAIANLVAELRTALLKTRQPFEMVAASALSKWLPQVSEAWSPIALMGLTRAAQLAESDYGRSTVVVHRDEAFRVEFILWGLGPEVYVHDHIEPGAFAVVQGVRIHTQFAFRSRRVATDGVETGELALTDAACLRPGDVVPIPPGEGLIHSLFYPAACNVTLSVRRTGRAGAGAAHSYAPPALRFTLTTDEAVRRDHQVLRLYLDQEDDGLGAAILDAFLDSQGLAGHLRLALSDWLADFPEAFEHVAARSIRLAGGDAGAAVEAALAHYQRNYLYRALHRRFTPAQALACHLLHAGAELADVRRLVAEASAAMLAGWGDPDLLSLATFAVELDDRRWPILSPEQARSLSR